MRTWIAVAFLCVVASTAEEVADQALNPNSPCWRKNVHVEGLCEEFGVSDPLCGNARARLLEKCPIVITQSESDSNKIVGVDHPVLNEASGFNTAMALLQTKTGVRLGGGEMMVQGTSDCDVAFSNWQELCESTNDASCASSLQDLKQDCPNHSQVQAATAATQATDLPQTSEVGSGLCKPLGVRAYEGNGDNEGTTQERSDRCAAACFNKKTALAYGPWSDRTNAVGYGMTSNGRCYCQHEKFESCTKDHTSYTAYEFTQPESAAVNKGGSGCTSSSKCAAGEGDCDTNADCNSGLKCFQRSGDEDVPGVTSMASMPTGYDFCYNPHYGMVPLVARITADDKGSSGCTSSSKCAAGGGDCDSDADCNSGLKCMQRGRRRRGGSQCGLAVPGVDTGSDNDQDYCYDPSLLDITSAGPCNQPAAFNLDWRATETWCAANRDGAMEYGSIRLNRETTNLATDAEEFLVYEAGVKKVVGDNSYSVCGCKQTVFKMKRRKEHYGTSSTLTCPDTATTVNGVSAGPDIAGAYWCPVQQPYRTASVIGGCYNCGPSPCSFPDAKFRKNCEFSPHVVPLFS